METPRKRKRILTCYYRPKPGGLCKRCFRAISALLREGHNVHYLSVIRFPIAHPNCHFHRFPWPSDKTDTLLFWFVFHIVAPWQLLFIAVRYNITRAFAFGPTYSLLLQPACFLKRIPLTLFLRSDTIKNHRIKNHPWWIVAVDRFFEGIAISGVRMYGVSDTLTSTIVKRHRYFRPISAKVLRNDVQQLPDIKVRKPPLSRPVRLASVGILEPRKNNDLLIRCMTSIPSHHAHLFLYGTGPDANRLKHLATALNVFDRVSFTGWINSPSELWCDIDLLLFPSLHEGMSNAVLEALACQVPVLASDIPEHREILPAEYLLDPNRIDVWERRLFSIIFGKDIDEELSAIKRRQEPYAKRLHFDWDYAVCQAIVH